MDRLKEENPAALRARLEFPVWYRGFVKAYTAWSNAPSVLKGPLLLNGPPLAKAESWLLECPDKLTDSEKRFIVRSIAQRAKEPTVDPARAPRPNARGGWRRSSDRYLWHLLALTGL